MHVFLALKKNPGARPGHVVPIRFLTTYGLLIEGGFFWHVFD
jgi:hypothetical protein